MDKMIIVYNMGNFKTGKTAQTNDKQAKVSYEQAGYKLISAVMMSATAFLSGTKKK